MERRKVITTLLAGALVLPAITHAQPGQGPGGGPGYGAGKGPGTGPAGTGPRQGRWTRERLYGSPLMTLEERQEHQRRMWNAKTTEERQKIRDENRKLMLERAKQQNTKVDEKQDDVFFVPSTD
jgi:hypothetical protein